MNSTKRNQASLFELRTFGGIVGGTFLLIGFRPFHHAAGGVRPWALLLGALLLIFATLYPPALRYPHKAWTKIGGILGTVNSYVICSILFYILITPLGLILRILRKDNLKLELTQSESSYAVPVQKRKSDHFKFQF